MNIVEPLYWVNFGSYLSHGGKIGAPRNLINSGSYETWFNASVRPVGEWSNGQVGLFERAADGHYGTPTFGVLQDPIDGIDGDSGTLRRMWKETFPNSRLVSYQGALRDDVVDFSSLAKTVQQLIERCRWCDEVLFDLAGHKSLTDEQNGVFKMIEALVPFEIGTEHPIPGYSCSPILSWFDNNAHESNKTQPSETKNYYVQTSFIDEDEDGTKDSKDIIITCGRIIAFGAIPCINLWPVIRDKMAWSDFVHECNEIAKEIRERELLES